MAIGPREGGEEMGLWSSAYRPGGRRGCQPWGCARPGEEGRWSEMGRHIDLRKEKMCLAGVLPEELCCAGDEELLHVGLKGSIQLGLEFFVLF